MDSNPIQNPPVGNTWKSIKCWNEINYKNEHKRKSQKQQAKSQPPTKMFSSWLQSNSKRTDSKVFENTPNAEKTEIKMMDKKGNHKHEEEKSQTTKKTLPNLQQSNLKRSDRKDLTTKLKNI